MMVSRRTTKLIREQALRRLILLVALAAALVHVPGLLAANCSSLSGGNWNNGAIWSCGATPVAGDVVTINNGHNVNLNAANRSCAAFTVNTGGTLTDGGRRLTASGNVVLNGTWSGSGGGRLIMTGANVTLDGAGTFNNLGRLDTNGSSTKTILATANLTFAGANGRIDVRASDTVVNNGTVTLLRITGANATTSVWTNAAGATLNISSDLLTTGTLNASAAGNTVNYNGAAQTINTPAANTYHNLQFFGSGAKTAAAGLTVNGDLTLSGTATFAAGTSLTHTFLGSWIVNTTAATPYSFATSSILNFNTPATPAATSIGGTTTATLAFNDVNINNTSGVTLNENASFSTGTTPTLSVAAGATLTPAAAVIISGTGTLTGSGTVQVTRTAATADFSSQYTITNKTLTNLTVEYIGAAAQTVSALTYGGLKINNASGAALAGATTVGGTLTLASGALSVGANTLNLDGPDSTVTSGSLSTTSSSILTFGGSSTGVNVPAGVTNLNNMTINNTNGVSLGSVSPTLSGTLTLTSGTLSVGANTLTLNGPTIAGTPANLSTTSSSSLSFGGSSTGVNLPSSVTQLNNLTLNNTNGLTLNSSPTVAGTLTLTNGYITTGSNTLTIGSSPGSVSGAGTSSHVVGNVAKTYSATGSFTYPLGDGTNYTPILVNMTTLGMPGNLTAAVSNTDHPNSSATTSGVDPNKSINRYWTLKNPTLTGTASLTLTYIGGTPVDNDSGVTVASFRVRRGATCSGSGAGRSCTGGWSSITTGTPSSTTASTIGVSITSGASESDLAVGEVARFAREKEFIYSRERY